MEKKKYNWKKTLIAIAVLAAAVLILIFVVNPKLEDMLEDETEEFRGQHMDAGYSYEIPGHWDKTDTLDYLPDSEARSGGLTISAVPGEENDVVTYTFDVTDDFFADDGSSHNCKGEKTVVTVSIPLHYGFGGRYEAADESGRDFSPLEQEIYIDRIPDSDHTPGDVICSLYFADVDDKTAESPVFTVKEYYGGSDGSDFSVTGGMMRDAAKASMADAESFKCMDLYNFFPVGSVDKEVLYLVLDIRDDQGGELITRKAWEYTWDATPETIEVPGQPGIIEITYQLTTKGEKIEALMTFLVFAAGAMIIAIAVLLIRLLIGLIKNRIAENKQ